MECHKDSTVVPLLWVDCRRGVAAHVDFCRLEICMEQFSTGCLQAGETCYLPAFRQLVEEFSDVADFLLVYIDEAHPSDVWAAPAVERLSFKVRKHRSLEERVLAAQRLLDHFCMPPQCQLVADCMDNNTNVAYGVSFERVCIVQKKKIAYLGGKGPFFYNLKDVRQWLEQSFGKR
ncbi:hypothetical protein AAFF_G00154160 [Aldrovandia affinis]|uniref:Iodothyronine deiodinase n=1 Tax=Aldrovandia affinis TaxID=143900 RepID=A0AAD7WWQ5_9TELE|nr:hypothetical protein AAFF_G00154160 [Aldrovandia affinis]